MSDNLILVEGSVAQLTPLSTYKPKGVTTEPSFACLIDQEFVLVLIKLRLAVPLSPPQRHLLVNTSERKKREAGALKRESGGVPRALQFFPLPSLRAFLPSVTVGGLCGGLSHTKTLLILLMFLDPFLLVLFSPG